MTVQQDPVDQPQTLSAFFSERAVENLQELLFTTQQIIDSIERGQHSNLVLVFGGQAMRAVSDLSAFSAANILENMRGGRHDS